MKEYLCNFLFSSCIFFLKIPIGHDIYILTIGTSILMGLIVLAKHLTFLLLTFLQGFIDRKIPGQ